MAHHNSRNVPRISQLMTERGLEHRIIYAESKDWSIIYTIDGYERSINRRSLFADQDWMDMPVVQ